MENEREKTDNDFITVVSFNLKRDGKFKRKNKWDSRKAIVADIIKESGAAVIGVQELLPSMKKDLKDMLRGYHLIGVGRSRAATNEHSDVIIKDEDTDVAFTKTFWLSKKPDKSGSRAFLAAFPRICTVVEITIRRLHQRIRVFNTHFDHVSPVARNRAVRLILKTADELNQTDPLPTILMGDFNAKPGSKPVQMLKYNTHPYTRIQFHDVFCHAPLETQERLGGYRNTYHGFKEKRKPHPIDYIFVSEDFEVMDVEILRDQVDGRYPSDHYPIIATLRLKKPGPVPARGLSGQETA